MNTKCGWNWRKADRCVCGSRSLSNRGYSYPIRWNHHEQTECL